MCRLELLLIGAVASIAVCDDGGVMVTTVEDTFDVGSPVTRFDDAGDPSDIPWFLDSFAGLNQGQLGLVSDPTGIADGLALLLLRPGLGVSQISAAGEFERIELAEPGDCIEVSCTFRLGTGGTQGFRMGLTRSASGPILFDSIDERYGHDAYVFTTIGDSATGDWGFFREIDFGFFLSPTVVDLAFELPRPELGAVGTVVRTMVLRATRSTGGVEIEMSIDGVLIGSHVDTDAEAITSFDGFGASLFENSLLIDNFRVRTNTLDSPCPADLAAPDGVLDIFDVIEYLSLFDAADPAADLAAPVGVFDIFDVIEYLALFDAGC